MENPAGDTAQTVTTWLIVPAVRPFVRAGSAGHYRFFGAVGFAFSRSAASLARNFAMHSISCPGMGSESGKRIYRKAVS